MVKKPQRSNLLIMIISLILILYVSATVYADDNKNFQVINTNQDSLKVTTVSDAEKMISMYFEENNIHIDIGSEEYVE